jgi:hypothetical protein
MTERQNAKSSTFQQPVKRKGQREAGDEFVLWIITNLWNAQRCTQVRLTPKREDKGDFDEFPVHINLQTFDRSDRVFVSVANAHSAHPPILVACDTDYWLFRDILRECHITVDFLCEDDVSRIAKWKGT